MSFKVVIPARYGSTRLPGKPLLDLAGKPVVQRVWEQACRSGADLVVIATDDERIRTVAETFGARVCMTSASHPSGTDRLQEVATALGLADDDIVVNVQGDEPLVPPAVIDQVANNLAAQPSAGVATLCAEIDDIDELCNPNAVKVVTAADGMALYFSRAPVPWPRDAFARDRTRMPEGGRWWRHIGLYAYRAAFLHQFVRWQPAPPEQCEQLEQLRVLYQGVRIHVAPAVTAVPPGVDTPDDLEQMRRMLAQAAARA